MRLLLSDSTNAETAGYTPSEQILGETISRVFAGAQGRVIVATFASLLSRVQLVIETAAKMGRKVAGVGDVIVVSVKDAASHEFRLSH